MLNIIIICSLFIACIALIYAACNYTRIKNMSEGTPEMARIASYIREGANTFISNEMRVKLRVVIAIVIILAIFIFPPAAVAFIVGTIMSASAGIFGMKASTIANVRVTNIARESKNVNKTLRVALLGGCIMGLCVASLSLIGVIIVLGLYHSYLFEMKMVTNWCGITCLPISMILSSYGLGCSTTAVFNRMGGGIFTKAADMGADLVGKTEKNIPEDSPQNPGTIADNVGDNVGDTYGLGSDLLESNVGSIIGAMIIPILIYMSYSQLGQQFSKHLLEKLVIYPIGYAAIGLLSCIIALMIVLSKKEGGNPSRELEISTWIAAGITAIVTFGFTVIFLANEDVEGLPFVFGYISPWISSVIGIASGIIIGLITCRYTDKEYKATREIVEASEGGPALTITQGISTSMKSTLPICATIGLGIYFSALVAGSYGIAIAAVGMLSFVAMTVSVDSFGPIADNAGGIAEMAECDSDTRKITDSCDSAGNTTAAMGKGFAIGSAAFAVVSLLTAFLNTFMCSNAEVSLNVVDSQVLCGVVIGGALMCYLSGMLIEAVSETAEKMIAEIRRQFRENPELIEGKAKPDYEQCVRIATKGSLQGMKKPAVIAILAPIVTGFIFGPTFVGGLLFGAIVIAIVLAIFYGNSGGAWDNAKKYIEEEGLKGTDLHKASVVGDTVGDPLKDTAGPSLNILVKIMTTVALVTVCFFSKINIINFFG